jgi:hypothetical protein
VRGAPDELLWHPAGHLLEVAAALLGEEQGEEVDLEEQVAELVEELVGCAGDGRVGDLVGLLDRVGDDRAGGLLAVPGTVPPQPLRQLLQLQKRRSQPGRGGRGWLLGG